VAEGQAGLGGEVVDAVGSSRENLACRHGIITSFEVALGVGHVEGVIPDLVCIGVLVGIKIEVGMLGQDERCYPRSQNRSSYRREKNISGTLTGPGRGCSPHLDVPGRVLYAVRDTSFDLAGHALLRTLRINDAESDGVVGHSSHVPDSVGPVVCAAMQSVVAIILLRHVRLAVESVHALSDTADVSTGDGVVNRMSRILGYQKS